MADWFVSPGVGKLMEKVIDSLFHYVQDQFRWQTGMKKELENIRANHLIIQAVLSTARRVVNVDQNSPFNKWIWQLRDAIDEVDDLLDDLAYKKHQQHDFFQKFIEVGERLLKTDPDLKRLEEAVQKLDRISGNVATFLNLFESIKQEQQEKQVELHTSRETGSFPTNDLIGRGEYKEFIIEWVRKPSNEEPQTHVATTALYNNISLLSIVGHGGMGKTTLLQHVYEDEITEEFDLKIWVCVSDSFDVKKVIADMLESVHDNRSLSALQKSLKSKVMSKKFLLVLDDIWDDKEEEGVLREKWGNVVAPLAQGGLGSKILITTRTDSAASMIAKVIRQKKEVLRLGGLKEDECLELLAIHAFADADNLDDHKNLKFIAREMVKKLYGCPLVAKVMGGVLNSNLDERHWRNVLNSSLGLDGIFPILKLSYTFLSEHLQSCFSFCSIFKQDHVYDKDDLVRMWIAVGFVQSSHNNQEETLTLEDLGEQYFDVLIRKSFFDEVFNEDGDSRGYKMHDLLHELAQFVSKQECFRFVGDEESLFLEIPETIRHLSVETSNPEVLKSVGRFKNLRTLHITNEYDSNIVDALIEIFQVIRSVRLLHLNYSFELKMIPEEIEYLQHLRYLRFSALNVKLLPRSLSSLYNLQFIIFDNHKMNSFSNDYFPRDMNNLFNLRYLTYSELNFPGIGKLKFLQELKKFKIKNENGYKIEELEHMNRLRYLKLTNLKDVRDAEEAYNAKLCDKRKLTHLSLKWNKEKHEIVDRDLAKRVLDNLQPHNYLKTLKITYYMGARSATWMNEAYLINNLQKIQLQECLQWEILPPFGQLPFLRTLELWGMPKVKRLENKFHGNDMCSVFPSLQKLSIRGMEALVDWFDASVVVDLFPCLTILELSYCPNLQELPYLPPKLQCIEIDDIGWKTLNCCSISKSLRSLKVRRCPNIRSISPWAFPSLQKLHLEYLEALVYWFHVSVRDGFFPCLIELHLSHCPKLQELPDLPPKLETLHIHNIEWNTLSCSNISKSIPLRSLEVQGCRCITSISVEGEISKLEKLIIGDLQSLRSLPCSLTNIISSLEFVELWSLPQLKKYPDLPLPFRKRNIKELKLHMSFTIDDENELRFEELERMNEIRILHIFNLKYVRDAQEAYNAKLCDKRKLIHLSLNWDRELFIEYFDRDLDERVLDNLQPHIYLKKLNIHNYMGVRSAIWMNEAHRINNLQEIIICQCREWEILPPFGQLPFLKTLRLQDMLKAKRLDNKFHGNDMCSIFPSLETLYFQNLHSLVDLFDESVVDGLFPCLTKLYLYNCPKLQELPYLPPKLKSLFLYKIGWKTLNCCSISKSIPLEIIEVRHCRNITSISLDGDTGKLKSLTIEDLPSLESFPSSLANISSLEFLKFAKVPLLQECPDLPPSLKKFYFSPELMIDD